MDFFEPNFDFLKSAKSLLDENVILGAGTEFAGSKTTKNHRKLILLDIFSIKLEIQALILPKIHIFGFLRQSVTESMAKLKTF